METENGTASEEVAEPVEAESGPEDQSSGGNPAWEPLREKLDPITFRSIEPVLKGWDTDAQTRITSLNDQLKPWKAFQEAGVTPERVTQLQTLSERIESEPEAIYEALGEFLKQNGRMPSDKELTEAVEEKVDEAESETAPVQDPRFAQLEEQQAQMMQFLKDQQSEREKQSAEKALDAEIETFKTAHPEYRPSEVKEVLRRAAFNSQQTGKIVSLEDANSEYAAFRTELLEAQRPGDSAPKLPPLSGGAPTQNQTQRKMSDLSKTEIQDLTANYFAQKNNG